MVKEDLRNALRACLFNVFRPDPYQKAGFIIGLCGYYGGKAMPEDVKAELSKLTAQQTNLHALKELLETLEKSRSNEFRWEPHFHREHMPEHLTMNPTFNVQRGDDANIVAVIEKLRSELNNDPVSIDLLLAFIARMARETGDLNFEENG
jgi:hypothetical protein